MYIIYMILAMADTTPSSNVPLNTTSSNLLLNQVAAQTTSAPWLNATLAAQIADKIKANSLNGEADDLTSFETKKKVDDVKQKLYVFGLAIVAYFIYTYASAALTDYTKNTKSLTEIEWTITEKQTKIDSLKANEQTLKQITRESDMNNLVTCINNSNLCDKVLTWVKRDIAVTRSYLLLTPLSGTKMDVDQKTLLKYFNEYLLVEKDKDTGIDKKLWQLLNITFTEPSLIDQSKQIYTIGVDTTIIFPNKVSMMQMIKKVESWLDSDHLLLIKISSINYDIVKFEESQTVSVSFTIYQYKK